ncbi:MAG: basic amino acid ABC transporter substrate-binding protein [Chloroflexi bacterium]|nr:basic amino acid ABC transporter substrate-binding protein [Anaerolineaceae bacterium]NMB87243.1 basic amino acid ABC transporter substrate-binding protein [Chloroflexota bacterium]
MKKSLFVLSLVVALSLVLSACGGTPAATEEASKTIRVATDATWPPFETVNESTKEIQGFDIDLMNAIAEKTGLTIEYVNVGWDPLLAGMAQCQYDAAISAMTITDERKEQFLFSEPYINAGQIVSVRKDETEITGPDSLPGKTIGVQIGTTGAIEAEKIEGATVKTYDTVDLAFLDLMNKQIDAVVADYPTAVAFVGQNADALMTVGEVFTDESYGIAVCKNNQELVDQINEGLAAVKADNLIPELEAKWLSSGE